MQRDHYLDTVRVMLRSGFRNRNAIVLILAVFIVVIVLFSGLHHLNGLDGKMTSHQANAYSCLFTICVAVFTVPMFFLSVLFSAAFLQFIPLPGSEIVFLIEKPPRR